MKKIISVMFLIILVVSSNIIIAKYPIGIEKENIQIQFEMMAESESQVRLYYLLEEQENISFSETQSVGEDYHGGRKKELLSFSIPANTKYIRIDPCEKDIETKLKALVVRYKGENVAINIMTEEYIIETNEITVEREEFLSKQGAIDPNITIELPKEQIEKNILKETADKRMVMKIAICLLVDLVLFFAYTQRRNIVDIIKEVVENRKLIFSLAKNDFKTKFAGSYFGIVWAFVQPVVTVVVYWFVFEKALSAGAQLTKSGLQVPYALWLVAGLVPWFFFSETIVNGTNVLLEYTYLVKKVVFKISILPVVKTVSSLFVHLFFVGFTIILFSGYQYYPSLYTLQIIYYSIAMILLCLGIIYATSAIVIFFRDLSQVISIFMQIAMWMTPILWNMDAMESRVSPIILNLLKLNPMYYIVSGYRSALIDHVWFWERPEITLYYWCFVIVVFGVGFTIFKKLKIHFADVL